MHYRAQGILIHARLSELHPPRRAIRGGGYMRGDQGVNLAVARVGYAWWYRKYAHKQLPADRMQSGMADEGGSQRLSAWP